MTSIGCLSIQEPGFAVRETIVLSDANFVVKVEMLRKLNDNGVRDINKFDLGMTLRGKVNFSATLQVSGNKNR